MNVLFLVPYPVNESPSQRFRFEQYFAVLNDRGYKITVSSFLDPGTWRLFSRDGQLIRRTVMLLKGFLRRLFTVPRLPKYDYIFIHREVTPLGPPVFEWLIAKVFRKKVIYDFDDAIWLTDRAQEPAVLKMLKWRSKVGAICRWSHVVSCGNEFLCAYARRYNSQVLYNPTTVDTSSRHLPLTPSPVKKEVVIGWTGSYSTLKYLEELEDTLAKVEKDFPEVILMVIADKKPRLNLARMIFRPWTLDREIEDLGEFDIGIMPLPDNPWAKGKCGFKALQYMALEIPAVASPVGVNTSIIDHSVTGLLASTPREWEAHLRTLILDPDLRRRMGKKAREKVIGHYSVASNTARFLSLFA